MSEILAPAGSPEVLEAALAAGADAVYFGLKKLNARRGAANFEPSELGAVMAKIHEAGAKGYLTLNIQIAQRELGLAYRTLQCAQDAGVDAVLITDPALLAVRPFFPKLEFHFSTQAGVSSSAGVLAGKALGLSRVVLARELSMDEMAACSRCGIEIETFVQGAHCFSCSGRCLLSSWGGGRSGNRGACTSPCRVRWTNDGGAAGNPLSMHDMSLLGDLDDLEALGIASYKIEGRLKTARWVSAAVSLYRSALTPGTDHDALQKQVQALGDYSGRKLSDAFFHGITTGLTGDSARPAGNGALMECGAGAVEDDGEAPRLILTVGNDEKGGTVLEFRHGAAVDSMRIPPQRIANPKRAVTLREILDGVPSAMPRQEAAPDIRLPEGMDGMLLPKSIRNSVLEAVTTFFRMKDRDTDGVVRNIALPAPVKAMLDAKAHSAPENRFTLGARHTHVRIRIEQLEAALKAVAEPLIVSMAPMTGGEAEAMAARILRAGSRVAAVALPEVIYERQLKPVEALLAALKTGTAAIEVNSWDTWQLARNSGLAMTAGPGLAVLNAAAARELASLGCRTVMTSPEIDQEQLEELCQAAEVPLAITVYSRPKLMLTRAVLPTGFGPEDHAVFQDSRHTRLKPMADGAVTCLRPETPMDWRNLRNPKVRAAMMVLDLSGDDEVCVPPRNAAPFLFNYDRRLR